MSKNKISNKSNKYFLHYHLLTNTSIIVKYWLGKFIIKTTNNFTKICCVPAFASVWTKTSFCGF